MLIELLILYSLVYFMGLKTFLRFFVQLKWSGRIYTLTAVSGLTVLTVTKMLHEFSAYRWDYFVHIYYLMIY